MYIYDEPVQYYLGDLVVHNGLINKAMMDINYHSAAQQSPDLAGSNLWQLQAAMKDDVRQNEASVFAYLSLIYTVNDIIYLNGYEKNFYIFNL